MSAGQGRFYKLPTPFDLLLILFDNDAVALSGCGGACAKIGTRF
ncbi:MAG: hypothetical protein QGH43_09800 [Arenicellales bacterium]|jgi:hypothetical protein|nr:hypothetical protein [Arenicellales bacterium]MDP6919532.1 hypothetical protein [Arenicellales bacterium]|tara:strand:- start:357 stop:488 length:132 start_codon:yes stop_codon:yes gene_type:complete